jgi:hypothetical protein
MRRQTTLPAWLRLSTTGQYEVGGKFPFFPCSQYALENPFERLLACSIPPQPFPSYAANAKFLLHSRPSLPISPFFLPIPCFSQLSYATMLNQVTHIGDSFPAGIDISKGGGSQSYSIRLCFRWFHHNYELAFLTYYRLRIR